MKSLYYFSNITAPLFTLWDTDWDHATSVNIYVYIIRCFMQADVHIETSKNALFVVSKPQNVDFI